MKDVKERVGKMDKDTTRNLAKEKAKKPFREEVKESS
jgi:hypothetical protein